MHLSCSVSFWSQSPDVIGTNTHFVVWDVDAHSRHSIEAVCLQILSLFFVPSLPPLLSPLKARLCNLLNYFLDCTRTMDELISHPSSPPLMYASLFTSFWVCVMHIVLYLARFGNATNGLLLFISNYKLIFNFFVILLCIPTHHVSLCWFVPLSLHSHRHRCLVDRIAKSCPTATVVL